MDILLAGARLIELTLISQQEDLLVARPASIQSQVAASQIEKEVGSILTSRCKINLSFQAMVFPNRLREILSLSQ